MTFTVALLLLLIGMGIGYLLPGPVAKLKIFLRRRKHQPTILRAYHPATRISENKVSKINKPETTATMQRADIDTKTDIPA